MSTTIYLIRHAQPESHSTAGRLTEFGKKQAKKVATHLRREISGKNLLTHKPLLVVSPTNRTLETADYIAKALHLHPLVHRAFSENYLVDTKTRFWSPSFLAHHVATSRIYRAFRHIVSKNPKKTIIVVTHGNVIRVLCGKLLRETYAQMSMTPVVCGSITVVSLDGSRHYSASVVKYEEIK